MARFSRRLGIWLWMVVALGGLSASALAHDESRARAEQYTKFYDALMKSMGDLDRPPTSTEGQPFYYYGNDKVFFAGDAFSAIFRDALEMYLAGVSEECPKCDVAAVREKKSWLFVRLFKGAVNGGFRFLRNPLRATGDALCYGIECAVSAYEHGKDEAIEFRGKIAEVFHRRGAKVGLVATALFLIGEGLEHLIVAPFLPPNPVTCGAVYASAVGCAGVTQDILRWLGNSFVPASLLERMARVVSIPYYAMKFRRRWNFLVWADRKIDKRRKDYAAELLAGGRKLEAFLARSTFWGEVFAKLEMEGAPARGKEARPGPPFGGMNSDIDFLFADRPTDADAADDAREQRVWRVYQHTNGLFLLRSLIGEALAASLHESEDSDRPMTAAYYAEARGKLGDIARLLDFYFNDLYVVAIADKIPAGDARRAILKERLKAIVEILGEARGLLDWKATLNDRVNQLLGSGSCTKEMRRRLAEQDEAA